MKIQPSDLRITEIFVFCHFLSHGKIVEDNTREQIDQKHYSKNYKAQEENVRRILIIELLGTLSKKKKIKIFEN